MALVRGGITVKAHVQAFANACQVVTGADSYGTYAGHSPPEGPTQALDVFTPDNAAGYALQDRICAFAMANVERFGIRYLIRREYIWNIERAGEGWRWQGHQGNRTADHFDHVHVTFYATADVPDPAPSPEPVPEEDDDIMRLIAVDNDRGIFLVGATIQASGKAKGKALARHIGTGGEITALVDAGVVPGYDKRPALPSALFDRLFSVVA